MKLRNKILALAIVAVAGVNAYIANDVIQQKNDFSLLNLENIAEGYEICIVEGDGSSVIGEWCEDALRVTWRDPKGNVAYVALCPGGSSDPCTISCQVGGCWGTFYGYGDRWN